MPVENPSSLDDLQTLQLRLRCFRQGVVLVSTGAALPAEHPQFPLGCIDPHPDVIPQEL